MTFIERLETAWTTNRSLVCVDDRWGAGLARRTRVPVTTFGMSPRADVRFSCRNHGLEGISVRLEGIDNGVELRSPLVGVINASNVAAAYVSARLLGVPASLAARAIARERCLPYRPMKQ